MSGSDEQSPIEVDSVPEGTFATDDEQANLREDILGLIKPKTNFERLAWCIDEYLALQSVQSREEDSLLVELNSLRRYVTEPATTVEQVKKYDEITGGIIGLLKFERFQGFLQGSFRNHFDSNEQPASLENLLEVLGFPHIKHGASILASEIDTCGKVLADSGVLSQTVQGSGIRAFQGIEGLLEYVLSFFGRWLSRHIAQEETNFVVVLIGQGYIPQSQRRSVQRWYDTEDRRTLSIGECLPIIQLWNSLVREMDGPRGISEKFQADFPHLGTSGIISEDRLSELENFNQKRSGYAHNKDVELPNINLQRYQRETRELILDLYQFARYLRDNVIPKVISIQHRRTSVDGLTSLDCLHEDGAITRYSFRNLVSFYPGIEYFFHVPGGTDEQPIDEEPILLPVDFRWKEQKI